MQQQFGQSSSAFGSAAGGAAGSMFGGGGAKPAFGQTSQFGQGASRFGQTSQFGQASQFGGQQQQQQASPFGGNKAPFGQAGQFGQAKPGAFGAKQPFGQTSQFGQKSTFGQQQPQQSAFGAKPSPFGQTSQFGQQQQQQPQQSAFGAKPSPFGQTSQFGGAKPGPFGQTSQFGQSQAGPFGAKSSFGATTMGSSASPFGAAKPSPFGQQGQQQGQQASPFGGPKPNPFGGGQQQQQSPFGAQQGQSPFGQRPQASPFGGGMKTSMGTSMGMGTSPFGAQQQQQPQQQAFGGQMQQPFGATSMTSMGGSVMQAPQQVAIAMPPQMMMPPPAAASSMLQSTVQAGVPNNVYSGSPYGTDGILRGVKVKDATQKDKDGKAGSTKPPPQLPRVRGLQSAQRRQFSPRLSQYHSLLQDTDSVTKEVPDLIAPPVRKLNASLHDYSLIHDNPLLKPKSSSSTAATPASRRTVNLNDTNVGGAAGSEDGAQQMPSSDSPILPKTAGKAPGTATRSSSDNAAAASTSLSSTSSSSPAGKAKPQSHADVSALPATAHASPVARIAPVPPPQFDDTAATPAVLRGQQGSSGAASKASSDAHVKDADADAAAAADDDDDDDDDVDGDGDGQGSAYDVDERDFSVGRDTVVSFDAPGLGRVECRVPQDFTALTPTQLKSASNIKVAHKEHGSVQWFNTVDLSGGYDFAAFVKFFDRAVEVYPSSAQYHPEQGVELNSHAVITLNNVFKRDSSGNPVTDQDKIAAYKRKVGLFCFVYACVCFATWMGVFVCACVYLQPSGLVIDVWLTLDCLLFLPPLPFLAWYACACRWLQTRKGLVPS